MDNLTELKKELIGTEYDGYISTRTYLKYKAISEHYADNPYLIRAYMTEKIFLSHKKHVYENDLILGSLSGLHVHKSQIPEKLL